MSVIVKGMKMPKKGEYLMTLYVDSDGSAYIDVESFPDGKDKFEAIQVQPHSRLIDANALLESIKEARKKDPEIEDVYIDDYFTVAEWVVSAPTIIEAEGT